MPTRRGASRPPPAWARAAALEQRVRRGLGRAQASLLPKDSKGRGSLYPRTQVRVSDWPPSSIFLNIYNLAVKLKF